MLRSHLRRLALPAVCVALAASGCSASDSAVQVTEVRIGVLQSLSGANASLGTESLHGAELAASIVNNGLPGSDMPLADGKGLPGLRNAKVTLVPLDTAGNANTAASEVTRLVNDDHVTALEGTDESGITLTMAKQAERLGVPLVNGNSTAVTLTQQGFSWFYRVGPTDLNYAQPFFGLLKRQQANHVAADKIAIMYSNDQFGNDGSKVIQNMAGGNGEKVVATVPFDPAATDLSSQVQQVRGSDADALFVFAYPSAARVMLNAFHQLAYVPPAVFGFGGGFSDPAFVSAEGKSLGGVARRATFSLDLAQRNPVAKAVTEAYQKKYGNPMADNSARMFTATMALIRAINNAKSTDRNAIRSALGTLDIPGRDLIMPWDGVKFDDQHQNIKAVGIVDQYVQGGWKIVYPSDVASHAVAWPASTERNDN